MSLLEDIGDTIENITRRTVRLKIRAFGAIIVLKEGF